MTTVEVYVSKGAAELARSRGWPIKAGEREFGLEEARDIEADMWVYYVEVGGTPQGRAAKGLSRALATALESTRTIEQVHAEIRTVLDGKWDDGDAVETHIQHMVHRGWDRTWAMRAIADARRG